MLRAVLFVLAACALFACDQMMGLASGVQLAEIPTGGIIGLITIGGIIYAICSNGSVERVGKPQDREDTVKMIKRTFEDNNQR